MIKHIVIVFFIYCTLFTAGAQNNVAALSIDLKNAKTDTARLKIMKDIAWEYQYTNPDTSIILGQKAYEFALKIKWKRGIGSSLHELSWYYYLLGDFKTALNYSSRARVVFEKMMKSADPKERKHGLAGKGTTLSNCATIYLAQGKTADALQKYYEVLAIDELQKNENDAAIIMLNIGSAYGSIGNIEKAGYFYKKALKIGEKNKDESLIGSCVGGLGGVETERGNYKEAIGYFKRGYNILNKLGDKAAASVFQTCVGVCLILQKKYAEAIVELDQSLAISNELKDVQGTIKTMSQLGKAWFGLHKYKVAENYLLKASRAADSLDAKFLKQEIEEIFGKLYQATGQFDLSIMHFKQYVALKDSLESTENANKEIQSEMNYEFAKKMAADSIKTMELAKRSKLKHDQEIKQQRNYTITGIILFVLMLLIAGVAYRANRAKQKDNLLIEKQKRIVEEKQKEVLASIHYAKRIQIALLPSDKYIKNKLAKK